MSDLAGAAAAMGVPEALVKRSAEARAKATGSTVDEVLAAWAGGGTAPAAPAPASTPPASTPPPSAPPSPAEPLPPASPPVEVPAADATTPPAAGPVEEVAPRVPPVLVGRREGLGVLLAGSTGLLILSVMLAFLVPSLPQAGDEVRTSNRAFSTQALAGRTVYSQQGCGACHTQLIRNVVSDIGLGPVTLDDTNQIIGYRRIGPDLAAIGSRIEDTQAIARLLAGEGNHPPTVGLTDQDLTNLIAYLRESK
ncbi:MAG TPA: cbb3-type cytochrome c oxidase subunit II [Acidimicrobiia bacterium]|nr:cbb3-type cytochrome c oxidase subunit II [Acidimicrobiia bacterium]